MILLPYISFCQTSTPCLFFESSTAIFYGIDFTGVKFVNDNGWGFDNLEKIRGYSFNKIDKKFYEEDCSDINLIFDKNNKSDVICNFENSYKRNVQTDIKGIINTEVTKLSPLKIDSIISFYPYDSLISKIGILIIAQNLVKDWESNTTDHSYGSFILAIFETKTHNVILHFQIKGFANGMGFENYWYRAVKNAIYGINMRKIRKIYCAK